MRRLFSYTLLLAIIFSVIPVSAQSSTDPNALVRVYPAKSTTSTMETFAPGDATPKNKQDYFSGLTIVYSVDGKWAAGYGLVEGSTAPQVFYGQVGQTPTQIKLPDQQTPIRIAFSPDAHYFVYTLLGFTTQQWTMGIVDVTSGKQALYTGKSSPPPGDATADANTVQGMAMPGTWTPDGKTFYLQSFIFSNAATRRFDGLYSLNVSDVDFTKTDPVALPQTTRLLQSDQLYGEPAFSPDGSKAVYATNDSKNAPENYAPTKFSQTSNTLWLLDLQTGKSTMVAQAAKGEAIAVTQWMPDSKSILYAAGGFQKTSYVVGAHGYLLDLSSGTSKDLGVFEPNSQSYLINVLVCGDNAFFVSKVYKDDFSGDTTLYSAPLADLKSRSAALAAAQNIALVHCIGG